MTASRLAVAILAVSLFAEPAVAAPSCLAELGPKPAAELARQCREVAGPGEAAACRPGRDCEQVRAAIRRGCEEAGADAPPFCEYQVDIDDDEEDDG